MKLQQIAVETRLGIVPLRGRFGASDRPLLVVISGAFDNWRSFEHVPDALPGADVALLSIPGFGCPELREVSVAAFTDAFREALAKAFPERRPVVAGVSLGALVALGLPAKHLILSEPFFSTAGLTSFTNFARNALAQSPNAGLAHLLWSVFGVSPAVIEDRDYSGLLETLCCPTTALVGDTGSFLDERARRLLMAHPRVTMRTLPGIGHDVVGEAESLWLDEIRRAVATAQQIRP